MSKSRKFEFLFFNIIETFEENAIFNNIIITYDS